MKVKLIQMTQNPIDIMWTAARTCYSEKSPIEIWEDRYGVLSDGCEHTEEYIRQCQEKHWKLVKTVLDSGHQSVAEHVSFTFAIEGISRSCSHQLVRHRAGIVFSQQSQRYVEIKESYETLIEAFDGDTAEQEDYLKVIANKYFVEVTSDSYRAYIQALINYLGAVKRGIKPEDARMILPNATKTNITTTINLRELIHTSNLRLCSRASAEIRQLFKLIKKEVEKAEPKLASLLVPSCEAAHGICYEHNSCGRCPTIDEVMKVYNKYKEEQSK